ncbi:exported hypothetical protein [Nitrospina gracilis 3/211]|uniref:Lipoprotein n=1 Tax=Nitrospina gracilis (strain 3/211) TaxID=1266370 RepID=M1Z9Y0_NITG3|nr:MULTISPECIES: hypothetical protein [Nitrospina]MCF8722393.1 ABC-type Fe3+-hydroxamate transport system substrate-binding protein [Nitrospina sp. Nb-3]CCQ90007.1 exported hypothetical protein [Nitrospina gracilis 3/211]
MKILTRIFAIMAILMLIGCASNGGAGSSSSSSSSSSYSDVKQLTSEDYERLGIKETNRD